MTIKTEDCLEHFGVKGMRWGVRSSSSSTKEPSARQVRYDNLRNKESNDFSVTTKNGETVDVKQQSSGKLSDYVMSLSKSGTKLALNSYEFEFSVDGKNVGQASLERRGKDELYLNWLGVDSTQRGKGYGSSVFDAAVQHGKTIGVDRITLEVPVKSPDARHIYEKQGFVVSKEPTKAEQKLDTIWGGLTEMELDLTKLSVKHAKEDKEDELERAIFVSFPKLPLELEKELFGDGMKHGTFDKTEAFLAHYGKKGMKWGVRTSNSGGASSSVGRAAPGPDGVSSKVNKAASKDAAEFARAKMFYGEGAGTRRKLIKAQVEAKSKLDPNYQKAFDHHLSKQDMGKQAIKAQSERRRKDAKTTTVKTAKGVHRQLTGGFGAVSLASAVLATGYVAAKNTGADKIIMNAAKTSVKKAMNNAGKNKPDDWLKKNGFV